MEQWYLWALPFECLGLGHFFAFLTSLNCLSYTSLLVCPFVPPPTSVLHSFSSLFPTSHTLVYYSTKTLGKPSAGFSSLAPSLPYNLFGLLFDALRQQIFRLCECFSWVCPWWRDHLQVDSPPCLFSSFGVLLAAACCSMTENSCFRY